MSTMASQSKNPILNCVIDDFISLQKFRTKHVKSLTYTSAWLRNSIEFWIPSRCKKLWIHQLNALKSIAYSFSVIAAGFSLIMTIYFDSRFCRSHLTDFKTSWSKTGYRNGLILLLPYKKHSRYSAVMLLPFYNGRNLPFRHVFTIFNEIQFSVSVTNKYLSTYVAH